MSSETASQTTDPSCSHTVALPDVNRKADADDTGAQSYKAFDTSEELRTAVHLAHFPTSPPPSRTPFPSPATLLHQVPSYPGDRTVPRGGMGDFDHDLNPFAGFGSVGVGGVVTGRPGLFGDGSGGNLMGSRHPIFTGGGDAGMNLPHGVPPGARHDPVFPPDVPIPGEIPGRGGGRGHGHGLEG
jgi:hypothetical protein